MCNNETFYVTYHAFKCSCVYQCSVKTSGTVWRFPFTACVPCVFKALSVVANHRHVCWAHESNGQSEAEYFKASVFVLHIHKSQIPIFVYVFIYTKSVKKEKVGGKNMHQDSRSVHCFSKWQQIKIPAAVCVIFVNQTINDKEKRKSLLSLFPAKINCHKFIYNFLFFFCCLINNSITAGILGCCNIKTKCTYLIWHQTIIRMWSLWDGTKMCCSLAEGKLLEGT